MNNKPESGRLAALTHAVDRVRQGEATAAEAQAAFEAAVAHRQELLDEISATYTVADLRKKLFYPPRLKADMVSRYLDQLLQGLIAKGDVIWAYGEERYAGHRRALVAQTDADIAAAAQERRQRIQAHVKAVTNPTTLAEFETFLRVRPESDLSDDQLALYDTLVADAALARREEAASQAALVEQLEATEDLVLTIRPDYHDRRYQDIWIVQLSRKVERAVFDELAAKARRFGARWSSWGARERHGFLFWSEADAQAFVALGNGDGSTSERRQRREEERQQAAAERLAATAGRLQEQSDASATADRRTNTARRARMAEHALQAAEEQAQAAGTLANVAAAIADGRLRYLARLRHAADVETLEQALVRAKYARIHAEKKRHIPDHTWRRPVALADIRYVEYPWPHVHLGELQKLLQGRLGRRADRYVLRKALEAAVGAELVTVDGSAYDALANLLRGRPNEFANLRPMLVHAARLRRLGIETLPHLRAALREYLPHRAERPTLLDKVRLMELDLIGRNIPGYFPTPPDIVARVLDEAGIESGHRVLEPSAGKGNIADAVRERLGDGGVLHCCEVNSTLTAVLEAKGHTIVSGDFLGYQPDQPYDRVVMNPPFEARQDVTHIRRAYDLLRPGGRLVAIASVGWTFGNDSAASDFRTWLQARAGRCEELPEGAFKSGERPTSVKTVLVIIDKE